MSVDYIVYEASTGKITGCFNTDPAFISLQVRLGLEYLMGTAYPGTQYVYNGQVTDRPLMDSAPMVISKTDNVAENEVITITGVPAGADIYVDGEKYNLVAGETVLELTFDTVGTYPIRVVAFPYQDWERTVTVV